MSGRAASAVRHTRDHALLVRRFAYGESSLVVHALTREHGRVHLLAKGAYRLRSRFFGRLDLFDTLELAWSERAGVELGNLEEAELLERRQRIPHSLASYRAALTVLELASLSAPERAPAAELFELCSSALQTLHEGREPELTLVEFELAFLHNLGLAPALEACASCGGAAPAFPADERSTPRVEFSASAGGRLCAKCAQRARASGVRVGTLPTDVLELAARLACGAPPEGELDAALLERTRDFTARFLRRQLDCQPKSYRVFLAAPHRNRPLHEPRGVAE